jgi:hypothetical protein
MKMLKRDIMMDAETLDTQCTAMMLSLAAIAFDPDTGEHLSPTFYVKIDLDSYAREAPGGFTFSAATLAWWMDQSQDARKEAFCGEDRLPIRAAIEQFFNWCKELSSGLQIRPWSHGASFDIPLITYTASKLGLEVPWNFWDIRDTRTLYEIHHVDLKKVVIPPVSHPSWKGTKRLPAHHPLADCAKQIEGIRLGKANDPQKTKDMFLKNQLYSK